MSNVAKFFYLQHESFIFIVSQLQMTKAFYSTLNLSINQSINQSIKFLFNNSCITHVS